MVAELLPGWPRRRLAIDIAAVFFFVGVVVVSFGVAMLLPAMLDLIDGNLDYRVFLIGPCCNFTPIPAAAKWLLAIEMLAGRLEILVLAVPLTRTFWRS